MKATGNHHLLPCGAGRGIRADNAQRGAHLLRRRARIAASAEALAEPAPFACDELPEQASQRHRAAGDMPRVLHIDSDSVAAQALADLLTPEAHVTHVPSMAAASLLLRQEIFSLIVIDHEVADFNASLLLPALASTPLLVYSASTPAWREPLGLFLPKPWTTARQLWTTIARLLGIAQLTCAGD